MAALRDPRHPAFRDLPQPVRWQRDEQGPEWMPETLLELPSGARVVLRWEVVDVGLWTSERPIEGDFTVFLLGDDSCASRRREVLAELTDQYRLNPGQVIPDHLLAADLPFDLASPVPPWVVITVERDRVTRVLIDTAESAGVLVRRLDGRRMTDPAGVFEEFARALEFPDYFGRNWDALVDCLDDLHGSWHGHTPVTAVIRHADAITQREFFPLLVTVLCQAAGRANLSLDADGLPRDRPPVPLHFVLLLATEALHGIAESLDTRHDLLTLQADARLLISARPEPEADLR